MIRESSGESEVEVLVSEDRCFQQSQERKPLWIWGQNHQKLKIKQQAKELLYLPVIDNII